MVLVVQCVVPHARVEDEDGRLRAQRRQERGQEGVEALVLPPRRVVEQRRLPARVVLLLIIRLPTAFHAEPVAHVAEEGDARIAVPVAVVPVLVDHVKVVGVVAVAVAQLVRSQQLGAAVHECVPIGPRLFQEQVRAGVRVRELPVPQVKRQRQVLVTHQ